MSLCDVCYAPGHCCRSIVLSCETEPVLNEPCATREGVEDLIERNRLPFVPTHTEDGRGRGRGRLWYWRFSCRNLLANGRCGDYDNRPTLCREYEPMSDGLCVHNHGTEAGDPSAGVVPHRPAETSLA